MKKLITALCISLLAICMGIGLVEGGDCWNLPNGDPNDRLQGGVALLFVGGLAGGFSAGCLFCQVLFRKEEDEDE